jgi:type IV secretory pathway protease TraF
MSTEGHPLQGPPKELDLSAPGARDERAKLKRFHARLNHSDVVPEQAFRMASSMFPLVCYVNNIVALYTSKNYEVIPIFISRAHGQILQCQAAPAAAAYLDLVSRYLRQIAYVLKAFSAVSPDALSAIPDEILAAGPQEAPPSEA